MNLTNTVRNNLDSERNREWEEKVIRPRSVKMNRRLDGVYEKEKWMGEESYAAVSWRTETRTIHSERKVWGKTAMKKRQLDGKNKERKSALGKKILLTHLYNPVQQSEVAQHKLLDLSMHWLDKYFWIYLTKIPQQRKHKTVIIYSNHKTEILIIGLMVPWF